MRSDGLNLRLTGDNGGRGWNWSVLLDRKHVDDSAMAPVTMSDASLTLSYPFNRSIGVFATGGYEQQDYHSTSSQPEGKYWSLGVNWTPSPRTSVSASSERFFGLDALGPDFEGSALHRSLLAAYDKLTAGHPPTTPAATPVSLTR